jgi:hypothetical protein
MPMPIDLWITKTNGEKILYYIPLGIMRGEKPNESGLQRFIIPDWSWTHPSYQVTLNIPFDQIRSIEIDSSGLMADVDRSNNVFRISD